MSTHNGYSHPPQAGRPRSVALFGGSFDPIHVGHLAVARAAQRRFHLDEIHFVPCGKPPFKSKHELAAFPHRYAMVSLACVEHQHFLPSLAEAGRDASGTHVHYSIDTVRHFRAKLRHEHRVHDALYFITGADTFLDIPMWKSYEDLLDSVNFIVVSRPGFRLSALRLVIPPDLYAEENAAAQKDPHTILLRHTQVHLLDSISSHVSATEVRRRRHKRQSIHGLVPARVEEYILRQALYL